jgi:hypothetical protein
MLLSEFKIFLLKVCLLLISEIWYLMKCNIYIYIYIYYIYI